MELSTTKIDDLIITGYQEEYIFETIRQSGQYYENDTLNKWILALKDAKVILDIGANLGNHSLFWAKRLHNAEIYSFEPYRDNFACLQKNVEANGLGGRIFPINKAVGALDGYADVSNVDESNLGGTTFAISSEPTEYQVLSVDSFTRQSNIIKVDFVKIDTEGFELLVLNGMVETLRKDLPVVWVEISYESYRDVGKFLAGLGYTLIDYSGFNMLYATDSTVDVGFNQDKVFDEMLKYLERTNFYYKAYNKAKQWSDDNYDALNQSREKYRESTENYNKLKGKYGEAVGKYTDLQKQHDEVIGEYTNLQKQYDEVLGKYISLQKQQAFMKSLNEEYAEELTVNLTTAQQDILLLQNLSRSLSRQQSQINALKQENREYRRKLSIITDTWYGKALTKCYRLLKEAYNRIRLKKGRGA